MSTHTPAPWHIGEGNGEGEIFAESGRMKLHNGGIALYPICTLTSGYNTDEDAANARLIAAAPELFTLLHEIHDAIADGTANFSPSGDWFREAKAAIAKATGEAA